MRRRRLNDAGAVWEGGYIPLGDGFALRVGSDEAGVVADLIDDADSVVESFRLDAATPEAIDRVVEAVAALRAAASGDAEPAPQPTPERPDERPALDPALAAELGALKERVRLGFEGAAHAFPRTSFDGGHTFGDVILGMPTYAALDALAAAGDFAEARRRVATFERRYLAALRGAPLPSGDAPPPAPPGSFAAFLRIVYPRAAP